MNQEPKISHDPLPATVQPSSEKRSIPFLLVIGLFGVGLAFTISILDPYLYTQKIQLLAPPALKNTTLSFITIAALGVAFVIQPLVGQWSDHTRSRLGRRAPYLMGGVVGISLALVLVVTADSLWLLIVAALLVSACSNTIQGAWQALIPDRVPVAQHGTAAGIKTLLEAIGVMLGLMLVGPTLSQGNLWAAPLTGVGLFWLILLVTVFTLRTSFELNKSTGFKKIENPLSVFIVHFNHLPLAFPWWMVNRFLFWSAAIAIRTFMLNFMEDVLGMPLPEAQALGSQLSLVIGAGVFLLVLPAGVMADRIGRRPLLIVAGLLAAFGAVAFLFLRDLSLLFMAGGLIAIGAGIFASTSWALATDIVPKGEGALYLGLANAATVVGSAAGRLGGPLIDGLNHLTNTLTVGYLVVFGLAALFFVGSSVAVLKIKDTAQAGENKTLITQTVGADRRR